MNTQATAADIAALKSLTMRVVRQINNVNGYLTLAEANDLARLENLVGAQWDVDLARWVPLDVE